MNTAMSLKQVDIYQGDLDDDAFSFFNIQEVLAVDTETNGLYPNKNDLQLIQIASKDNRVALIQFRKSIDPVNVRKLLSNDAITKVFHHAPFDLGFLSMHAKAETKNVFCTKIASTRIRGKGPKGHHSLKTVSKEIVGVDLDKSFMTPGELPDWTGELTDQHVEYATGDVLVLIPLFEYFSQKLGTNGTKEVKAKAVTNNSKYY